MSHGICETVKVSCDNEQGFYVCNADDIPEGAELFEQESEGPTEGTVAWIKAQLDAKEIGYDGVTKKADLQELLDMANDEE